MSNLIRRRNIYCRKQKIFKRILSMLMAVCLVTGIVFQGPIIAYADVGQSEEMGTVGYSGSNGTELPDTPLGYAASENITQTWKWSQDDDSHGPVEGPPSFRFELAGRKARQGEVYNKDNNIQFTFNYYGFPTYIFMATEGENKTTPDLMTYLSGVSNQVYNTANKVNIGGKTYYSAKHGQHDADGNPIDRNFNYYNGYTETLKFGPANETIDIEFRITTSPSDDGKYMMVDYYIAHVGGEVPQEGLRVWLGSPFDLNINSGDLEKDMFKTTRGFYMRKTDTPAMVVDVITNDETLGVTPVDYRWVGGFANRVKGMFTESSAASVTNSDSSLAYSWEFDLRPNEIIHKRVGFALKECVYYVSSANGRPDGAGIFSDPLDTIEAAIAKVNGKNAYIYIQDYNPIDTTINFYNISNDGSNIATNIVISSADLDYEGNVMTDQRVTLTRGNEFDGVLFANNKNFSLTFSDITIDGNSENVSNANALIVMSQGTLELNSDVILRNNGGSAVQVTNNANFSLNGGYGQIQVKDNHPETGMGAVHFDSVGNFTAIYDSQIVDNINQDGQKANVYLSTGSTIAVKDDLYDSRISVTTQQIPEPSSGNIDSPDQEVVIAVPAPEADDHITASYFEGNFLSDKDTGDGAGAYTSIGSEFNDNESSIVLRRSGYSISFVFQDADSGGMVAGASDIQPRFYTVGDAVLTDPLSGTIPGYEYIGTIIEQGNSTTLNATGTDGVVTGIMPARDVVVIHKYRRLASTITFITNGGTPQPPTLSGEAGNNMNSLLPSVNKRGYIFRGWSEDNNVNTNNIITALPPTYPVNPLTYFAIFEPNQDYKFDFTEVHTNQSGSIEFKAYKTEEAFYAEQPITASPESIPGYVWSNTSSMTSPGTFDYDGQGAMPIGEFNSATGGFSGRMPGLDVVVKFGYKVDYDNGRFDVTVEHINENGINIAPTTTHPYFPEDDFSISPINEYGYAVEKGQITAGNTAGNFIYPVSGSFDHNWVYNGKMPNQPVKITYTYESTGEKFNFTTNYLDNSTADNSLRNIISPYVQKKTADVPIEADYQQIYGYDLALTETADPGVGGFDGGNNYSGMMPMDDFWISYKYNRDSNLWADITYKSDANGSITIDETSSPDIVPGLPGSGTYQASVLINDSSPAGNSGSYTWNEIQNKGLVPKPVADEYYQFAHWYIDKNGNGQFDEGEQLTRDYRFTGDETVIAYFEKDPQWWIDVHFATGQYGNFVNPNAETTLSVLKTSTWAGISSEIPAVEPTPNYLFDGWYKNDELVEETEILVNNQVYTARFDRDPNVFGTEVRTPDGEGHVDMDGSGKITLFGTGEGYQYFVADLDGKILAIKDDNDTLNRIDFLRLSPGSRYLVYEAYGYVLAAVGDNANNLTGVSDPGEILVPVIESNYYVTYDDNDDALVKLVINPADPDTDYALLDMSDNVISISGSNGWKTPTNTSPAQVSFGGLKFDHEYRVVGRPKNKAGVLPTDKINEGTIILTDFGGELEIPYYIIEAIGGTVVRVGEEEPYVQRYELAEEGDLVQLSADESDGNGGTFLYWKIIIGQVKDLPGKIYTRELEFEMPDTNIIAYAHYEVLDSNANVEEEVRGGKENEIALNPEDIPDLRADLTTSEDRVLIDTNGADVTYKVVFTKNKASKSEQEAITDSSDYQIHRDHIRAFKAAWGLDITIERYVNGRKTEMASPSNAQFQVITQLDNSDIDMMDYQLYEVETDANGDITASLILFEDGDPEENGGLFRFNGEAGKRYILVYSRAHRVTFLNEIKSKSFYDNFPEMFYRNFKVRRYGTVLDSYYDSDYYVDQTPVEDLIDNDGVHHWYIGWSLKNMPASYKAYNLTDEIVQKTTIYAYYLNNWEDVRRKRLELEAAIKEAVKLSKEPFLTLAERDEIVGDIAEAQETLDMRNRKAIYEELQDAIDKLKWAFDRTQEIVDDRNNKYEDQHTNGNSSHGGGGTGSGGGSGSGTIKSPYISKPANSYTVGTNGTWELKDGENNQWYFVLNGGIPLRSMWAYLEYTDSDVSKTGWYYFDQDAVMRSGWIVDEYGSWFYCNPAHDGWYGKMKSGWHHDEVDGFTYYLDGESGAVAIGWQEIEGKWYYFNTYNTKNTYHYNSATKRWEYVKTDEKSLGALYKSEKTPDGYLVDENGAWIE